jgi:UDP-galactopyranose mutase
VHRGQVYPLPINLATISQFFGRHLTPTQARELVAEQAGELATARRRTWRRRRSR